MKFYTKEEYDHSVPKDKWIAYCPFCRTDKKWKMNEHLLRENTWWFIVYSIKPCAGIHRYKKHLILVPKNHHLNTPTLSKEEIAQKQEAEAWLENYFAGKQYFSFLRHTDGIKSIQHIHYHYLEGQLRYRDIAKSLLFYDRQQKKAEKKNSDT